MLCSELVVFHQTTGVVEGLPFANLSMTFILEALCLPVKYYTDSHGSNLVVFSDASIVK